MMKYREWLKIWLENYIKPCVRERTYMRYEQIIRIHIEPKIGDLQIKKITSLVLQTLITELLNNGNTKTKAGLSSNTVNNIISVIQGSIKMANMLGYIKENTSYAIKRPRIDEHKIECFSLIEQKKIENAVLKSAKTKLFGIIICLYTGLRIGELMALRWKDINLTNGVLIVSHSSHDSKGGIVFDEPKTKSSKRIIPLPKQLLPRLKHIQKNTHSEFVISNGTSPISVRSYQRTFELLLKKLSIKHRGFHSLRHTFATRALECGMDVKTLSEILGHKNPTITLNRYAHSLLEHKVTMMNRLGELL